VYRYLANSPTPHTDSKGLASQNTDWLFDFGNNRRIAYVSRIAIGNGKNGVFVVRFQAKYEPIAWGGASSLTDVHRLEAAVEYTVRPEQEATLVKLIPVVKYSLPAMAKKNLKPVMSDGGWWIAQADGSVPLGEGTKRPMYSGKAYTGGATTARDKFSVSTENNSQSLLYQVLMVAVDLSKKKPCLIDTIRFDYQLVKGRHKGTGKTIFGLRTTVHGKLTEKGKSPLPLDKYETGINMTEDAREAIKKWHAFYFK
jgi:hypothetical protein